MKMLNRMLPGVVIVALATCADPGQAQVTLDISKVTCEQYVLFQVGDPQNIAIWLNGYYNGKRGNTVIDAGALQKNADKVEDYCRMNLDATVMDAVQAVLGQSK